MLAMSCSSHKRYDKCKQGYRNQLAATAPGAACAECAGPTEVTTLTSVHSLLPSVHVLLAFCRTPVCHTFRTYCGPSKSTYASLPTGRSPTLTDTSSQNALFHCIHIAHSPSTSHIYHRNWTAIGKAEMHGICYSNCSITSGHLQSSFSSPSIAPTACFTAPKTRLTLQGQYLNYLATN